MLHAAFLRSHVAHARDPLDRRFRGAGARGRRRGLYRRGSRRLLGSPGRCWCRRRRSPGIVFNQRTQVPLAKDKVRHVGEPLGGRAGARAAIIAEDALADIAVELEPLPAVVDLEKALRRGVGAACTRTSARNVAAHVRQSKGDYAAARAPAPTSSSRRRFRYDHGASSPIETRGVVANWDARANQLTVWDTTQAPVFLRNGLAAHARPERAAGARDRAVRRRRLRAEDHDVLSRRRW